MEIRHTCPWCGAPSEVPVIFKYTKQSMFQYIWKNPDCTQWELKKHVWGRIHVGINTVHVYISKIRVDLRETPYQLVGKGRPARYRIERRNPINVPA